MTNKEIHMHCPKHADEKLQDFRNYLRLIHYCCTSEQRFTVQSRASFWPVSYGPISTTISTGSVSRRCLRSPRLRRPVRLPTAICTDILHFTSLRTQPCSAVRQNTRTRSRSMARHHCQSGRYLPAHDCVHKTGHCTLS